MGTTSPMIFNGSRAARAKQSQRYSAYCSLELITKTISEPCGKGNWPHECLNMFRETPQLVRNFRILWASLPRTSRHEMLIKLLRETSNTTFRFLGIAVCQKAFQLMTGASSNVLQKARQACQKNQVTHLARAELGQWMEIRNAPRAPRYLVPWRL